VAKCPAFRPLATATFKWWSAVLREIAQASEVCGSDVCGLHCGGSQVLSVSAVVVVVVIVVVV